MIDRQHGFSLVELMIALVLGLLVSGALLQVFVMNNRSIVFQRASIITQDQGRVALDMVARYLRMAGYQESDLTSGNLTDGLAGTESGAVDSVTVRYQAGDSMSTEIYDCLGNPFGSGSTSSGAISINEFKLVADGNGLYNLTCDAKHELDGTINDSGVYSEGVLARNVEQLQFLYGEDTNNDQSPNKYVSADTANMSNVVAIKVCLVITSDDNMVDGTPPDYNDCEDNSVSPSDNRIRRKVGSTITLRNRAGGSA